MFSKNVGAILIARNLNFYNKESENLIELEENKRKILQIKSKLESIGDSL